MVWAQGIIGFIIWIVLGTSNIGYFLGFIIAVAVVLGIPLIFKAIMDSLEEAAVANAGKNRESDEAILKMRDNALKQRQENASKFKNKSADIIRQCHLILDNGKKTFLIPAYQSTNLQEKMWNMLNEISFNMQKIENAVAEIQGDK